MSAIEHTRRIVTVVVPVHDDESIAQCLSSLADQDSDDFEVIVVDSGSRSDLAEHIASITKQHGYAHVRLAENAGPGVARDAGIDVAQGDYVVYVDSDDRLVPGAIGRLIAATTDQPDLVAFNWARPDATSPGFLERRDAHFLVDGCVTRRAYLRHQMDGSVVFTMFRRGFLTEHGIRFRAGIHEDIDYLYSAYLHSEATRYVDECLYIKSVRTTSATESSSIRHIDSYLDAWEHVQQVTSAAPHCACGSDHHQDAAIGWAAVVASIARNVVRREPDSRSRMLQLRHLAEEYQRRRVDHRVAGATLRADTAYGRIFASFIESAASSNYDDLVTTIQSVEGKRWSCVDMQQAVFLAPGEVRTCCKRFYVDGERRGDVVLTDIDINSGHPIAMRDIANAKRRLNYAINSGQPTACDGCPFLSFDRWNDNLFADVQYLSMEHHSVCNLRCAYCDDTYFGGARPAYDVAATIADFGDHGHLDQCHTVVWGGGEPVLDPAFGEMLAVVAAHAPDANQRVLSNALRFSPAVSDLMSGGGGQLVTSIDAGTARVFKVVRGRRGLDRVLENLSMYLAAAPERVTIKYIITDDNVDPEELEAFAARVEQAGLTGAVFQISCDFKTPAIDEAHLNRAVYLFGLLFDLAPRYVFFDDLLQLRINWELATGASFGTVGDALHVAEPGSIGPFYLWGTGQLSDAVLDRPGFVDRWNIAGVVDSDPRSWGRDYRGWIVRDPKELPTDARVQPMAVQGMPLLLTDIADTGISAEGIVRQLLI